MQIIIYSPTPTIGTDEVGGALMAASPAIHDEGDGLILCYTHKAMTTLILVFVVIGSNWHDGYLQGVIVEFSMQSY